MIPLIQQSQKDRTIVMKTRSAVARGWEQAGGCDYQEAASREVSEVMELFWFLVMIMGTQICTCAKIHRKYGQLPNSHLKNKIKKQTNIHKTVKTKNQKTPKTSHRRTTSYVLSFTEKQCMSVYLQHEVPKDDNESLSDVAFLITKPFTFKVYTLLFFF